MQEKIAPGAPGIKARWTSSHKSGIGKALDANSNVAFTISHGILNEIYYPKEDIACVKDMQFLIADGNDFFSEEKKNTDHVTKAIKPGIPFFTVVNTCLNKKYQVKKEIICDPLRNTVLQKIQFKKAKNTNPFLYALIAPHINNNGNNNSGWMDDYKGIPMLFAENDGLCLAVACSAKLIKRSVGYVGVSDGWTDINLHKKMTWEYTKANNGNIALVAEIDIKSSPEFLFVISFGSNPAEAANHAWGSILEGFETAKESYISNWQQWLRTLHNVPGKIYKESASVLRTHEAKTFPGGIIASLSIPWGEINNDEHNDGYHIVWPRDLVEAANGFLALRSENDAMRILNYLMSMQQEDGSWPQNMWLEGTPRRKQIQLDQIALPVLLVEKCNALKAIDKQRMQRYWPVVKKAISYLIINGPYTQQDRWEEEKGYTPFTLATVIAALLAGADLAEENNEHNLATYCRQTADYWNDNIENRLYVTGTDLALAYNVEGYYIRINPYHNIPAAQLNDKHISLKNHKDDNGKMLLSELICVDALALVRFGLRAANDPKILNTIKLIDAKLKIEMQSGSCWHRYTNDGYGEDENGNPYDTTGIGRAWPLLTGERAHYEVAAGNMKEAERLIRSMESFANNGLLPEQIWDVDDIPEKQLFFGRPSGSAMPLTWAHAEYIKLCTSIKNKKVFDMPTQTHARYVKQKITSQHIVWCFNNQCHSIPSKKILRIEVIAAAIICWTDNDWETTNQTHSINTGIGIFYGDLAAHEQSTKIEFTFFWKEANNWENKNFIVMISQ